MNAERNDTDEPIQFPLTEGDLIVFAWHLFDKGKAHSTIGKYVTSLCRLNYDLGYGLIDRGKFGVKMPELRDVLHSMEGRRNKDKAVQPKPATTAKRHKRLVTPVNVHVPTTQSIPAALRVARKPRPSR